MYKIRNLMVTRTVFDLQLPAW